MVNYCMTDMRTNTARNIKRICAELKLNIDTVTPQCVREAWKHRTCLPDDEWKVPVLQEMLEEYLQLKSVGEEECEQGRILTSYVQILCEL